ncbi:hypothetical protein HHK36_014533 [Tetracentron sinense]|uniref:Uncharacterized protein n=1 Tax=Tetracentron sinense TaxID=13715 RepID=A0A834Z5Q2_TETSI|nr:hypothetical protein HHK36_014533 [Tetracentron sinense]
MRSSLRRIRIWTLKVKFEPSTQYDIDDDEVVDLPDEPCFGDFVNGIKYEAVMELEFALEAEGHEFYNSYARSMGFSMRKDKCGTP